MRRLFFKDKIFGFLYLATSLLLYFYAQIFKRNKTIRTYTDILPSELRESSFNKELSNEIFNVIEDSIKSLGTPSMQVSILSTDHGKMDFCTGLSNVEEKTLTTLNTKYYLASLSKLYTHAVILKLIQEDLLSFDDPISRYIDFPGDSVTIKHLLYHTSGLFDPLNDQTELYKVYYLGKRWTNKKVLEVVKKHKRLSKPGEKRVYSNAGYILLGMIAESITNEPFSNLLKRFFLEPFDLQNTFYTHQENVKGNLATGYDKEVYKLGKIGLTVNVDKFPIYQPSASLTSGGIVSNSSDMCQFLYKLFETNILDEKFKRKFTLAFNMNNDSCLKMRKQEGHLVGYNHFCGYTKSRSYYIVILTNLSFNSDGSKMCEEVVEKISKIMVKHQVV